MYTLETSYKLTRYKVKSLINIYTIYCFSTTATTIWVVVGMWDRGKPDYEVTIQVAE